MSADALVLTDLYHRCRYQTLVRTISRNSADEQLNNNGGGNRSQPIAPVMGNRRQTAPQALTLVTHSQPASPSIPIGSAGPSTSTNQGSPSLSLRHNQFQGQLSSSPASSSSSLAPPAAAAPAANVVKDARWWSQFPAVRLLLRPDFSQLLQENQVYT